MHSPRLLVVVAHPDDETFGCGSLLLHADARGVEVTVCCATRGEAGTPRPGSGVPRDRLGEVREGELRQAAAYMGVEHLLLLDHRDSDMQGDAPPDALVSQPLDAVAATLCEAMERIRPHVVVTLDGSDGHRDHVHVRDATLAAVEACGWEVPRVYLHCLPRSLMRRWADHMAAVAPDSPYLDVDGLGLGTPDEEITTEVDTSRFVDRRRMAIALHGSQVSPFDDLPDDLARAFLATDHLRRVRPAPRDGDEVETDIFAELTSVHD